MYKITIPEPKQPAPCGTYAGSQRHRKAGEQPCQPCADARNTYIREYRRRKGQTKSTLVALNTACPNCGHHITEPAA